MRPSIADGRDLTPELAKPNWSSPVTLKALATNIPPLISKILKDAACGSFKVGHCYEMSLWTPLDRFYLARCREKFFVRSCVSPERLMLLADNVFLLLEPIQLNSNLSVLVAWGFLYSLMRVKVMGENCVSLLWMPKGDSGKGWEQVFEVEDKDKLIEAITTRMQRLDQIQIVRENYKKRPAIEEDEVTIRGIADMDINAVNETMALYESSLEVEPSISKFQTLILLYQKVRTEGEG